MRHHAWPASRPQRPVQCPPRCGVRPAEATFCRMPVRMLMAANSGVSSLPLAALSHGNSAPGQPLRRAFSRPRPVQPAIAQQTAGHLRTSEKMERQHEYFGVPEDVAFIPLTGQSLSGNAAPLIMGWRHGGQMPDGIVQRHLIVRRCRSHFHPASRHTSSHAQAELSSSEA